jgi:glycopeptide antibiotics resistance protein
MIPRFLYPILPYRSFFSPFLKMVAIVIPGWLIVRVHRHRTRARGLSPYREIVLLIFVVYLTGLAVATLIPNHNSVSAAKAAMGIDLHPSIASLTCSSPLLPEGSTAHSFCVRNARGNLVLFFPLGVLIPLVWTRFRFWKGLQIAIGVSAGIEILQYFLRAWSNRTVDVNDVILNVAGASLGLMLVSLVRAMRSSKAREPDSC